MIPMKIDFIDRKKELEKLRKLETLEPPAFLIIIGRRRVGKTRLIQEFIGDRKDSIYLFAEEKRSEVLLESWSREVEEGVVFSSWDSFLRSILRRYSLVVIDEFQNFLRIDPSFFSSLQKVLDEEERRAMLIAIGSYVGMMKSIFEDMKSPLFGRASEIWFLPPLPMKDVFMWLDTDIKDKIEIYSMFGGFPKYYTIMKQYRVSGVESIWRELIIPKYSPLSTEPYDILLQEFGGEHRAHFSILEAVALGKGTYTEISDYTHISRTTLPRYLDYLINLGLLDRMYPVTEGARSKKGRYRIKDEFVDFWFRYIFPNMHLKESERYDALYDIIKEDFPSFVGKKFEDMVRDIVMKSGDYTKVGSWWNRRGDEIDIVALNERKKEILFGEVKWRNRPIGWNVVEELMEKKELVEWNRDDRKERFLIVSKSGFTKKCIEKMDDEGIMHWDLKDVERMIYDT